MKKIIILFVFLIPVAFLHASSILDLGSEYNPINVKVEVKKDYSGDFQSACNKINSMQYIPACASKYNQIKDLFSGVLTRDLGNERILKSSINYINYLYDSYQLCVNNAAQIQVQQNKTTTLQGSNTSIVCATGFSKSNDKCMDNNDRCKNDYGINSKWGGEINNTGGPTCECVNGYEWNNNGTACIKINNKVVVKEKNTESDDVKKVYEAICNKEDPNSFYYGALNDIGDPLCGCKKGYTRDNVEDNCVLENSNIGNENTNLKEEISKENINNSNAVTEQKKVSFWRKIKNIFTKLGL